MSADDYDDNNLYRLSDLHTIPIEELRTLYKKVVNDHKELKLEFEEF